MTASAATTPVDPPARVGRASRRAEFDDLVVRAYPRLVAEIAMLVDDRARAERLVRRALATTWRDWDRAREDPDPVDAVRTRLHQRVVEHPRAARRWWRRRPTTSGRAGADTLVALRGMPHVQRRALVLHHGVGRTLEQIAELEGVSAHVVRMRLAHGAHALAHHHPATPTMPIAVVEADPR